MTLIGCRLFEVHLTHNKWCTIYYIARKMAKVNKSLVYHLKPNRNNYLHL